MFKSIFSKLLVTVFAVLTLSFLVLALILSSFAGNYEMERKEEELLYTASEAKVMTEGTLRADRLSSVDALFAPGGGDQTEVYRALLSNMDDMYLIVTDAEGKILFMGNKSDTSLLSPVEKIPVAITAEVTEKGQSSGQAELFPGKIYTYAAQRILLPSGANGGIAICFSAAGEWPPFARLLTRTVLLASLWIVLGALLILYIFCERLSGPLKEMRNVSLQFAKGNFKCRVAVTGNDEIAALGTAFNQMADSLEQLENMRNSFVANVSHDLRTPMTTILGFVEGITSGAIPPEKQDYYLRVVTEEVRRLSRLVTELLDLSRLQSGSRKLNFTHFDICEMARLILISCEQRIDEKGLQVDFFAEADNILVRADQDAVHQVLYNLCDNAIKFARSGGRLSIRIEYRKKKVLVTVYNEGDGIPAEDIPYVFDRFYKADKSRGYDKSGAGLGLCIAKTIMDAHAEELTVDSRAGEFCAFSFTLQRSEE